MSSLPSFFNRIDFIGILLPGYVATMLWVVLFRPDLIFGSTTPPSEIFSSIVFVVAGPAIGLTLKQFHRAILEAVPRTIRKRRKQRKEKCPKASVAIKKNLENEPEPSNDFFSLYASTRLSISDQERSELDMTEAYVDFGRSVGVAFINHRDLEDSFWAKLVVSRSDNCGRQLPFLFRSRRRKEDLVQVHGVGYSKCLLLA